VVVGQADYGYPFTCAVAHDNIFAVQFHPKKARKMVYGFTAIL
jgi:imidazole glycerol-phosphate synthase subunit HisH